MYEKQFMYVCIESQTKTKPIIHRVIDVATSGAEQSPGTITPRYPNNTKRAKLKLKFMSGGCREIEEEMPTRVTRK